MQPEGASGGSHLSRGGRKAGGDSRLPRGRWRAHCMASSDRGEELARVARQPELAVGWLPRCHTRLPQWKSGEDESVAC